MHPWYYPLNLARILAVAAAVCLLAPGAAAQDAGPDVGRARTAFMEVERVSRMPRRAQKDHLKTLYHEQLPVVMERRPAATSSTTPLRVEYLPLEEAANTVLESEGVAGLRERSHRKLLALLVRHKAEILPLVRVDLRAIERADVERGLHATGRLQLQELYREVVEIFRKGGANSELAAATLRDLNDPRAIRELVMQDRKHPTRYYELLRVLQRSRPANSKLMSQLRADSPAVRWQAAYALGESGDTALVPHVRRLMQDPDARVREEAARMAFAFTGKHYDKVRPQLAPLLRDPVRSVRLTVATAFAQRQDTECGPTLLNLLRDDTLDETSHAAVVRAVQSLAGTDFGYQIGSDAWRPSADGNREAIRKFEEWIRRRG